MVLKQPTSGGAKSRMTVEDSEEQVFLCRRMFAGPG